MRVRKQEPRERAARALCRLDGLPENAVLDGRSMWTAFLPKVDAVLEAVMPPDECDHLRKLGP
jgi:hypothetical protein